MVVGWQFSICVIVTRRVVMIYVNVHTVTCIFHPVDESGSGNVEKVHPMRCCRRRCCFVCAFSMYTNRPKSTDRRRNDGDRAEVRGKFGVEMGIIRCGVLCGEIRVLCGEIGVLGGEIGICGMEAVGMNVGMNVGIIVVGREVGGMIVVGSEVGREVIGVHVVVGMKIVMEIVGLHVGMKVGMNVAVWEVGMKVVGGDIVVVRDVGMKIVGMEMSVCGVELEFVGALERHVSQIGKDESLHEHKGHGRGAVVEAGGVGV